MGEYRYYTQAYRKPLWARASFQSESSWFSTMDNKYTMINNRFSMMG